MADLMNWHEITLLAIDAFIGLMVAGLIHGAIMLSDGRIPL